VSKELKRKFGVKQIIGESRELICADCGHRAGLHYNSDCPKIKPNKELADWKKKSLLERTR
jgi:hypothetical protein